jgi:murein DD-endopeptidase MepM/ murein hydrolase activator NlpD
VSRVPFPARAALRRLLTALCLVGVLLPAAVGGAAADPPDDLDDVTDRLAEERARLEQLDGRRLVTVEEFQAVDARRIALEQQLGELNGELAGAQAALDDAERTLAATTEELTATGRRLGEAQREQEATRRLLADRMRGAYMYGGSGTGFATVMDVRDAEDFVRTLKYLQVVVTSDRREVETLSGLEREVTADSEHLARLEGRRAAERSSAAGERDRVAGLVQRQEALVAEVAAEQQRHSLMLSQLEADRDGSRTLIASFEAESRRLRDELASRGRATASRAAPATPARAPAAAAAASAPAAPAGDGTFIWPASGRLSSGFGYRTHPISGARRLHAGIDIAAPQGEPIWAAADGVVVSAGVRGGYGNAVVIEHGGGFATLYAHQSRLAVGAGQQVRRGEVIGYIGSTGYSTGPHLHFEVRVNGQPRDPMNWL